MSRLGIAVPMIVAWIVIGFTGSTATGAGPYEIVAFGDSTTAPRGSLRIYAQLLQKELPERGIDGNVVNAGVRGNTTRDARERWAQDVLGAQPNMVVIQFGINDSTVEVYKDPPAKVPPVSILEYRKNLEYFVSSLKERNIRIILMTPNPMRWTPELMRLYGKKPYQPEAADGLNLFLKDYAEVVRQVAATEKVALVDVFAAFESYGQEPGKSVQDLLLDGMHPNDRGHRLIANLLLPKIVEQIQDYAAP